MITNEAPAQIKNLNVHLSHEGFAIVPDVLSNAETDALVVALAAVDDASASVRRRAGVYAMRNLLTLVPKIRAVANSAAVRALVEPVLGQGAFPVRGILFDKTPDANWKVPWHQDLTIAVRERREAPGFGPWSEKAGVTHVQPPIAILERMLAVRLHLDECGEANAPLQVIPGSHRLGRLSAKAIAGMHGNGQAVSCPLPRGGALLMHPLLLHASSAAGAPGHRRVVHIEWAAEELPFGLEWQDGASRIGGYRML